MIVMPLSIAGLHGRRQKGVQKLHGLSRRTSRALRKSLINLN
jgi:hypothetical protein